MEFFRILVGGRNVKQHLMRLRGESHDFQMPRVSLWHQSEYYNSQNSILQIFKTSHNYNSLKFSIQLWYGLCQLKSFCQFQKGQRISFWTQSVFKWCWILSSEWMRLADSISKAVIHSGLSYVNIKQINKRGWGTITIQLEICIFSQILSIQPRDKNTKYAIVTSPFP